METQPKLFFAKMYSSLESILPYLSINSNCINIIKVFYLLKRYLRNGEFDNVIIWLEIFVKDQAWEREGHVCRFVFMKRRGTFDSISSKFLISDYHFIKSYKLESISVYERARHIISSKSSQFWGLFLNLAESKLTLPSYNSNTALHVFNIHHWYKI